VAAAGRPGPGAGLELALAGVGDLLAVVVLLGGEQPDGLLMLPGGEPMIGLGIRPGPIETPPLTITAGDVDKIILTPFLDFDHLFLIRFP